GKILKRRRCPLVITTGAKDKFEMRKPRDLASISQILEYKEGEGLKTVSENVEKIINIKNDRK
ncbi:MAG: hypothetical protein ACOCTT_01155, partial [archaeon]